VDEEVAWAIEKHEEARKHRWHMTSRLLTINDIYSFDPTSRSTSTSSSGQAERVTVAQAD
jgi:hypothetical protein